ncbi:right-handed parallel beta-helix repeat-containing protein [Amycolatopsis sp. NPDC049253]|uniref:right-handed parallel beta-helix repeat-containing protein n=1 Tax=Amycolatopsis sp. NPDC049253 TaxID=3155274 RepID=UPI0034200E50
MRARVLTAAALLLTGLGVGTLPAQAAGKVYHLDCGAATNGNGIDQPWNSVSGPSNFQFSPGDTLLIKGGTKACSGTLSPKGSGTVTAPITIDAEPGSGRPVIQGGTSTSDVAALVLRDQSNWTINNLTLTGGYYRSLWITGTAPGTLTGFSLSNLDVSGNGLASGAWVSGTGAVVIEPCSADTKIAGVSLTGVDAHDTHNVGIQIGYSQGHSGGSANTPDCQMGITGFAPKDGVSEVNISDGDDYLNSAAGIWLTGASDVTLTGNHLHANGTPGGLAGEGAWWSNTYNVTATENYAFNNKRGASDGGGLDADANSELSTIRGNHIYDNDSYCIAAFGQVNSVTKDVIVEDNHCTDNGQNPAAEDEGDLLLWTSSGSTISNYRATGNVIKRTAPGPVFRARSAAVDYSKNYYFSANTVTHPGNDELLIDFDDVDTTTGTGRPEVNHNTYLFTGTPTATFQYGGEPYDSISAWVGAGHDVDSTFGPASS